MVSCAVRSCCSRDGVDKKKSSGITFHRFPKNFSRWEAWVNFVNKKGWQARKHSVLCSKHFTEDCFDRTSLCYVRLKPDAVPTLNQTQTKNKVVTGYILYIREVRKHVVQNNPESTFGDIARIVGSEWKALATTEKQVWEERASKLNEETKAQLLAEQEQCPSPAPTVPVPPEHQQRTRDRSKTFQPELSPLSFPSQQKQTKNKVVTGYILYSREMRKHVVQNNPESTFGDISRIVGSEWKALATTEKQVWGERASKLNEETKAQLLAEQEQCPSPAPTVPVPSEHQIKIEYNEDLPKDFTHLEPAVTIKEEISSIEEIEYNEDLPKESIHLEPAVIIKEEMSSIEEMEYNEDLPKESTHLEPAVIIKEEISSIEEIEYNEDLPKESTYLEPVIIKKEISSTEAHEDNVSEIYSTEMHENSVSVSVQTDLTVGRLGSVLSELDFRNSQIYLLKKKLDRLSENQNLSAEDKLDSVLNDIEFFMNNNFLR